MNKYQDALNYLRNSALVTDHKQKDRVNQCTELLQNLIHEHFDNPPLKFEELDEEMWIWDKKEKKYIHSINNYDSEEYGKGLRVEIGFDLVRCPFEPNRFYRKQVEE